MEGWDEKVLSECTASPLSFTALSSTGADASKLDFAVAVMSTTFCVAASMLEVTACAWLSASEMVAIMSPASIMCIKSLILSNTKDISTTPTTINASTIATMVHCMTFQHLRASGVFITDVCRL